MSLTNIFVYGTVKAGQPNHHFVTEAMERGAKATLIGRARTIQRFPLVLAGYCNSPYLLDAPGKGKHVEGEVYKVDRAMLEMLDKLEDHPTHYERDIIDLKYLDLDDSDNMETSAYFLRDYRKELQDLPTFEKFDFYSDHGVHIQAEWGTDDSEKQLDSVKIPTQKPQ